MKRCVILAVIAALGVASNSFSASAVAIDNNPIANPKSVVRADNVRFTILTPQLIRLEWSARGTFEDKPSLVIINRRLPTPNFTTRSEGEWLIIETEALVLRYKKGSGRFTVENLEISFSLAGKTVSWRPGLKDTANLGGTIRTLDGVKGPITVNPGLLSRDGWTLLDESNTPLFDSNVRIPSTKRDDWPWVSARANNEQQDWYFFGYGHAYRRAMGDYTRLAGKIPMPPRYAFGAWWSRYWRYTEDEIRTLVGEYRTYDIPLDVFVIDMDWHLTFDLRWTKRNLDQAGQMLGWTGYSWDRILFPDPPKFLTWLHQNNFKITFNLHPASGIQPHEEAYPRMAKAMGVDPATKKYVPFNIIDKKFARNYFDLVLRPLEREGVDFWWIDWQQWDTTAVRGLNPTWWLNYSFYTDMERQGRQRPIILARWGGLGSHRHQIGFSGDVISDWSSLEFQPYFTSTAANVAFGYWSHDIGGHIPGTVEPELYARWVQWGVFSPIIRTHTTKNADAERRIWAYPPAYFDAMRKAIALRYELLPYIYSSARGSYDSGVSLCHPLYYDYPDLNEAYAFKGQYLFGDALMIAPIAAPVDSTSLLARESVWIPPGLWIEWCSGNRFVGPQVLERQFALDEIPVYVKAGAILPMEERGQEKKSTPADPLDFTIFPGDSGSTNNYEDDGNSSAYSGNEFALTPVRARRQDDRNMTITIGPRHGTLRRLPDRRRYRLRLPVTWPPSVVTVNGKSFPFSGDGQKPGWMFDGTTLTTTVLLPSSDVRAPVTVVLKFAASLDSPLLQGVPGILRRLTAATSLLNHLWPKDWSPDILIKAAQTGNRITGAVPSTDLRAIQEELRTLHEIVPKLTGAIQSLDGDPAIIGRATRHLNSIIRE